MYLKSLTIKGFKSFAQPTTFAFEPGVTCIVGPNGSGKSNVVDALAWVMGEQGAKTLRGGKMEDVIFAGTSTRGPLGRAQVLLTIDNSDGLLPIEYSEVTIARTLFRNGGSEYAINGENCRLLDVQELLSDTGLGREMHVIVGQGQLDKVLHATPEDRRGFIEEAAGILKHRRRKEKTLRKLDAMQTNLTRLSDLAGEIRRQLKPLGRQAEVARKAQSVAAVFRDAKARVLADDVVRLRRELHDHQEVEAGRKSERIVLTERLDQTRVRQQHVEQSMVGDDVDRARTVVHRLESVQERLRGLSSLANQRLMFLAQQADAPQQGPTVTQEQVAGVRAEADRLAARADEMQGGSATTARAVQDARAALDALDERIAAQAARVSQHDLEAQRLASAVDVARSKRGSAVADRERRERALAEAGERAERAAAALAELGVDPSEGGDETALAQTLEQARAELERAQTARDEQRDRLHALERERDALDARVTALGMSIEVRDGSQALIDAGRAGIVGRLADSLTVSPGFEAAIATALEGLADAVLADDRGAALDAVDHARAADLGRIDVVVADAASVPAALPETLPAGVRRATDLVQGPPVLASILRDTLVAETDDLDLEAVLTAAPHATVVTRSGDLVRAVRVTGGGERATSRIELVAERDDAVTRRDAIATDAEDAATGLQAARSAVEDARRRADEADAASRAYTRAKAEYDRTSASTRAKAENAAAEVERLRAALAETDGAVETADAVLAEAESAHRAFTDQERPVVDASERPALQDALEAARAAEVEQRIQVETVRERVRAERNRADQLDRQLEAERAAAEEAARLAVIRRGQIRTAEAVLADLPGVLGAVDRSLAEARVQLATEEAERSKRNTELQTIRNEERELRDRLQTITDGVHSLEMEIYEKKLHVSGVLDRAQSELGLSEAVLVAEYGPHVPVPVDVLVDPRVRARKHREAERAAAAAAAEAAGVTEPEEAAAEAGPDTDDVALVDAESTLPGGPALPEFDTTDEIDPADVETVPYVRAEQERRLKAAERDLGQLGKVNPLALEEFQALEQRHAFLAEQLEDLQKTRTDLLTIIDELDTKMQTIFESAFNDTKEAFDVIFPILFPGGSGSINLTDPTDLLGTGIDVQVKPAGKKIDRLTLLSGGERSLAAVALLVAIFTARPSPFYIMDEVEAALDDANLGRLLTVFERLRESSQLIVITHQKRTMEIADALYGVSMRQDGVSAVVGQRVQKREPADAVA
ncbi:AAA family ATPase [Curtobacterium flaccumfaciens]|uniref:AAA family ATPase n=1 Tax=Curtobacterium flaccumfaciens TaxID=2035 RepID=UPI001BDDDCB9|nr:AAA family ATPase [Curtobacterium flaccumfaciens]MBT1607509.1 AAA family ATPase [Curtobacterium flaccumfaciens pv. betae]MBT1657213.1 AAA family ATPase [Curtobacterium flaccumfaciens pv. betae]MCS0472395.1 AAA family ATPase [Curtobacterium flaccumfaciens pv. betae]MCS0475924.1 AAA family ATPase [Curtobacterium flaccumfaciens pv. betae]MCS0479135.1 AAA family ATPase [Curtobacterium flaccumfaciens pv. betae]